MVRRFRRPRRPGSIIPTLALSLISLFGFAGLAVDLGLLAVSRTRSQNGADVAALAGCRTLNNKPTSVNNNLAAAVANAKSAVTSNTLMGANFTNAQIQKVEVGQYLYDPTAQHFKVATWTDVTNSQTAAAPSGSWTAIRVTLSVAQPTYFMKVFGVNSMPTGAVATAVFRPRDTAFVLDMTGSMAYACQFNYNGASMNPDNLVPSFGHYVSTQSNLVASANQANAYGEAISRNNYCITTPGGPPIVRDFYYDPANVSNPATVAYPLTVNSGTPSLKNAFHCIPSSKESGGDSSTYTPPTYDFSSYNAFDTTRTNGPTPAPSSFGTMTDSGSITYVGDRWRRADGSINKTSASWATGSTATKAAANAIELLGYNVSGSNVRGGTSGGSTITTTDKFRDPVWEANGYDMDIVAYRTAKGSGNPKDPSYSPTLVPAADRFVGYSMGPGYWGKTFYVWPPDPRFDAAANLTSPDTSKPGFDTSGKAMCDWRRHFFFNRSGGALDPQADNNSSTTGSGNIEGINEVLLNTSSNNLTVSTSTSNWQVNYAAVLKWIKAGPQTLPPNLRAGRVLYYSSIPDDVDTSTGSTQQVLDKVFWQRYIDYVVGRTTAYPATPYNGYLYGYGDSWTGATTSISTSDMTAWTGPAGTWSSSKPYMRYNDNPNRPRLHFWFGPLSMLDFIANAGANNWNPGTCHEAQCWQLKAGMNSVLTDVRNNHPNDYAGLVMFAANSYNNIRRPMGQNFTSLKNGLFYPKSLLDTIDGGDVQTEIRPYNSSFTSVNGDEIPNANGSTDPNTGLAYAFNLLSPSASLPAATYGTTKGRRGASKVVIFETDGVPNTYRGISSGTKTMNPTKKGYDTYYPNSGWSSGNVGNGDATSMSEAVKVVQQIVKQMASTNTSGTDSGLSLPNAPARVYAIGFGDIFDPVASPGATFRTTALQFLADISAAGGTGTSGATSPPSYQIITGSYDTRISTLKDCMQRIFQAGVPVVLVE